MYVCIYVRMYLYIYMYTYVSMHVCVYVCMYVCRAQNTGDSACLLKPQTPMPWPFGEGVGSAAP